MTAKIGREFYSELEMSTSAGNKCRIWGLQAHFDFGLLGLWHKLDNI